MTGQIILSCPFCHHRAEYQDAPPGSTVRCHECSSIFRVPAMKQRAPGTVVKGEQIRSRRKAKVLVWLVVLAVLAGGGWCAWQKWFSEKPSVHDRWADVKEIWPEDTPQGALQRFLLSWKEGNLEWLMEYTRPSDQPDPGDAEFADRLQSMFANIRLVSYEPPQEKPHNAFVMMYRVHVVGVDTRTGVEQKGSMSPRVVLEKTPKGKQKWGVDLLSATPRWD
ncbi:MAG TPA: hypothetical protein VMZ92_16270 [Planctomycetota bacterium]|nr:hypothetical protein [Planctomycetota bacterium]